MSYRTLEVDGKEYEYTVGHTYVKIRGYEVIPKHKIGTATYDRHGDVDGYQVTPALIRNYISLNM